MIIIAYQNAMSIGKCLLLYLINSLDVNDIYKFIKAGINLV